MRPRSLQTRHIETIFPGPWVELPHHCSKVGTVQPTRFNQQGEPETPGAFEKNASGSVLALLTLLTQ